MLVERVLLPGILVPGVAAFVALGATVLFDRRRRGSTVGGGSLALGAGFAAGFVAIGGWPRWPPVASTQRLFYLVVVAALLGLAWGWWKERRVPRLLRGTLLGLLLVLVLWAPLENTWDRGQAAAWLGVLFAVGLGIGWSLDSSLGGAPGWRPAVVRLALLGGTAVLLALSGSASLAQLLGATAGAAAVVEIVAPRSGRRPWLPADSMVLTTVVLGLLLAGYFFAALEPWPAALAAVAWLLVGPATRRAGWRLGLALLPLAIALALAGYTVVTEGDDPYGTYGAALPAGEVRGNNTAPAA